MTSPMEEKITGELCIYGKDGTDPYGTKKDINGHRMSDKPFELCPFAKTYRHSSYDGSYLWKCERFGKNIGSGYWGYSNEVVRLKECLELGPVFINTYSGA